MSVSIQVPVTGGYYTILVEPTFTSAVYHNHPVAKTVIWDLPGDGTAPSGKLSVALPVPVFTATPPPPPPPPSGGPHIPSGLVAVGAKFFDSIDYTSSAYDSGAGGSKVFGSMNNATNNPQCSLSNGILTLQPGSTICTLPQNTPGGTRGSLGAKTGGLITTGIWQTRCRWPGSGDAVTDWSAVWLLTVNGKRELDYAEAADWSGGAHPLSTTYHPADGSTGTPNVFEPPGNWADGNFHDHVIVITQTEFWVVWDGVPFGPYAQKEAPQPMFCILTCGAGTGALEIESNQAWLLG